VTPGCPAIRSLVQRFDVASAGTGRPAAGGYHQGRPARDDGQTADRASRSRSLTARWTVPDILPSKPRWMTTATNMSDKSKQTTHAEDLDRQRQVSRQSGWGEDKRFIVLNIPTAYTHQDTAMTHFTTRGVPAENGFWWAYILCLKKIW